MFDRNHHSPRRFKPLKVLFFIMAFLAMAAALSGLVMLLWNAILPEVAGVKPLTFWQAAGLLALAKILFGRFGGGRPPWKQHARKKHWKGKWMKMSQEERQEARERWKAYCEQRKSRKSGEE